MQSNMNSATIARVQQGMRVVDATGEEVGKVAYVKMGDPEAVTTHGNEPRATGLTERFADVVAPSGREPDVPDPVRSNLLRTGFIKIKGHGLFAKDRYVSIERVRDCLDDEVRLDVAKDNLEKEA
jgi:hypothetical protein